MKHLLIALIIFFAVFPASSANADVSIICAYDWPCEEAVAVAWCESRLIETAYNPAGPYVGWFQVENGSFDAVENTAQAYAMWTTRGWQPWPHCGRDFY